MLRTVFRDQDLRPLVVKSGGAGQVGSNRLLDAICCYRISRCCRPPMMDLGSTIFWGGHDEVQNQRLGRIDLKCGHAAKSQAHGRELCEDVDLFVAYRRVGIEHKVKEEVDVG